MRKMRKEMSMKMQLAILATVVGFVAALGTWVPTVPLRVEQSPATTTVDSIDPGINVRNRLRIQETIDMSRRQPCDDDCRAARKLLTDPRYTKT